RTLDLDILLWSEGMWAENQLAIPHPAFRMRSFVLTPAAMIAPDWRDPVTSRSIRQLQLRLNRPKRLDPQGRRL
ncbi:MAG TPA: 2-amino-4-hydroxy-6-hydroxymethyldihydropteridine diphosphokinase, partial [Sphingorhabdus sp.]|nr:2-amino-4-hydroxy-6-hydroxymethyldihydropteridine diphosphokinase [Sphingorhabdus sp.]